MGKGRPRKVGRRDKSGKLRPIVSRDYGNRIAAEKTELFGTDGWDPIGRAYRMGLLGENGQALMTAARILKAKYNPTLGLKGYTCPLDQSRGGGVMAIEFDPASARYRQDRMFDGLSAAGPKATLKSFAFYGLVIDDDHADSGPGWLDRLIAGSGTSDDEKCLAAALEALTELAA